jgi:kynureninase
MPVDVAGVDADFAVGGSYKYLRGGPGACFLYVHPRHVDGGLRTLDIGWFAKRDRFDYLRPDPPELAPGGDAFLESTPPVLTCYQARAGAQLALALDPARLREHSLAQQAVLVEALARHGIDAVGARRDHGAFVVVRDRQADALCATLGSRGIVADARGPWLRLCPDILTRTQELHVAARALADAVARR